MNNDPLEKRLQSIPWRSTPPEWKRDLLRNAAPSPVPAPEKSSRAIPASTWRAWIWPHPLAWAGLALIWLTAAAFHQTTPQLDHPGMTSLEAAAPPSTASWRFALLQQQKLRQELLEFGPFFKNAPPPPELPAPPAHHRPRSGLALPSATA